MKHKQVKISRSTLILMIIVYVISSACQYLPVKAMNKLKVELDDGSKGYFQHPCMVVLFIFMGNLLSVFIAALGYFLNLLFNKNHSDCSFLKQIKTLLVELYCCFSPSFCSFTSQMFYIAGLFYLQATVQANLKCFSIFVAALISFILIRDYRSNFGKQQIIGLIMLFLSLIFTTFASFKTDHYKSMYQSTFLGIVLTLFGCIFNGIEYVIQERHIKHSTSSCALIVFLEGVWGVLFSGFLILVASNLTNPFSSRYAAYENIYIWYKNFKASNQLRNMHYLLLTFTFLSEYFEMQINKLISSSARVTYGSTKFILIWIFSIAVHWEQWDQQYQIIKIVGYIFFVLGIFIYNSVIMFKNNRIRHRSSIINIKALRRRDNIEYNIFQ